MRKIFLFIALCYNATASMAQSGKPDPAFGDRGIVRTDLGSPYNTQSSAKQVLTSNSRSIFILQDNPSSISKRFENGSLDSSYGFDGYARIGLLTSPRACLQPDGKIVVAGKGFALTRITARGTPDSTFTPLESGYTELAGYTATAVNVDSKGRIVVSGTYLNDAGETYFAVFRYQPDGTPDNTFNNTGRVITDFQLRWIPPGRGRDSVAIHRATANAATIQPDDKIILAGFVQTGYHVDFAVVRYNIDGSLDGTFDGDGRQYTQLEGSAISMANSVALQSDGKVVLGGRTMVGNFNRLGVARYNANGARDSSFHNNGTQAIGGGVENWSGIFTGIQENGKIVVAGTVDRTSNSAFLVTRFNTNGNPDSTFDSDGVEITNFPADYANVNYGALQADDKILLAGESYAAASPAKLVLTRYDPDGAPDNSFGNQGKFTEVSRQGNTQFNSIAIQADGKAVVAGFTFNGTDNDYAIARYNVDGTIDNSFDADGTQITDFGGTDEAFSVLIQPDGKIVVAGNSNSHFSIARYNADGTPDISFGAGGKNVLPVGFADFCQSAALQPDGKIVVSGYSYNDTNYDSSRLVLIRFNANGTPDNTFSGDGFLAADFGSYHNRGGFVAILNDGKIMLAGGVFLTQVNVVLARYNPDGSVDNTFSGDGNQLYVFGNGDFVISSMAIQTDGKIVTGGFNQDVALGGYSFALARFQPDGVPDNGFSGDGYQSSDFGPGLNFSAGLAIRTDGSIAVGGIVNNNFAVALYQPGGDLDRAFGDNGLQTTIVGLGESRIRALAFSNTGLYAAGSGRFPASLGVVTRYLSANLALPLDVLDFNAVLQNNMVLLRWKPSRDKIASEYIVERSGQDHVFVPIDNLNGKRMSPAPTNYSSTDVHPLPGVNFYRLKIVDNAGGYSYSEVVAVKTNIIAKLQLFPNPATDQLYVAVTGTSQTSMVTVIDLAGKILKKRQLAVNGRTYFSLNIADLPTGIYNLVIEQGGKGEVRQFVKR